MAFYIDPIKIAESHGIDVIGLPRLENDVHGLIKKTENGIVIQYDNTMHTNRIRFTVAHELAHFLLGHLDDKPRYRDPTKNFNIDNFDPIEAEANKLAARILMPKEKIDFLLYEQGITNLEAMAKLLQVSKTALSFRLQSLGYIS